ncbi:MAG: glutamate--tRNA ligase family protein, partial [Candidatus Paceibacterota bacterium]
NQVVRGDDLIASTFRQLDLIEALGGTPPQYAHVPLVCGPDGRRLAKRHGDTRIDFFREAGVPPEQLIGWAAWSAGLIDRWEKVAAKELVAEFSFARLRHEPTTVDAEVEGKLLEGL